MDDVSCDEHGAPDGMKAPGGEARLSEPAPEGDRPSSPVADEERTSDTGQERPSYPGVGVPHKAQRRPERDDLEQRLQALSDEVRAKAADAEKKRREATALEAKVHIAPVKVPETHAPDVIEAAKVVLAPGLDPRHDPTMVGRRNAQGDAWEFGVVEDAEGERPSAPDEANAQEKGAAKNALPGERRGRKRVVAGVLVLLGAASIGAVALHSSSSRPPVAAGAGEVEPRPPAPVAAPEPARTVQEEARPAAQQDMAEPAGTASAAPVETAPVSAAVAPGKWTSRRAPAVEGKKDEPAAGTPRRPRSGNSPLGKDPEY